MPDNPLNTAMAAPKLEHPVHWVESDQQLAELCRQWQALPMIAVDTEFMRSQTYFPKPALVQVNDGEGNYLIDPLAIKDFAPLKTLLSDQSVVKVLHSCSEDLEVFQTLLGTVPENIFDTQAAAALLGYGFSMGYANLVQKVLNVELPKGETRSNWLQRPLSQAQTLYAAIDVEYLLVVAEKLRQQLAELERLSWLEEDAARLASAMRTSQEPDVFYLRVKSAWKLNRRELAVLKRLAAWREEVAQRRDVPRNRVVKEHVLFSLAKDKPRHLNELRRYEGMTERVVRADGETLLGLIHETLESDEASWPQRLPKPLSPELTTLMKKLKAEVLSLAEQLNLAPEMLLRKKDYETIIRAAAAAAERGESPELPEHLRGWREQVIGDAVLQAVTGRDAFTHNSDEAAPKQDLEKHQDDKKENGSENEDDNEKEPVSGSSKMLCDVYRSSKKPDMYLYVAREQGLEAAPEALLQQFGRAELAMTMMLTPNKKLAHAKADQVMASLQSQGYYLQLPPRAEDYMQSVNVHNAKLAKR